MSKIEQNIGLLEMPAADYHANEAVGRSQLSTILCSPAHYRESKEGVRKETKAFGFGTAVHAAVLEPDMYAKEYATFDESLLEGTLVSMDDYKTAASNLGVRFEAMNKEELKAAIKAADEKAVFKFKDEVQAEMAALTQERLVGALASLDDLKAAAESLGIVIAKMKKDDLKAAIKAADTESKFTFKEDVQAEMAALTQERLMSTLSSLDDYKNAAAMLSIGFDPLNKEELKAAIIRADIAGSYLFREDKIVALYGDKTVLSADDGLAIESIKKSVLEHSGAQLMLESGYAELSAFWTDPDTGIECKCRPDWLIKDLFGNIVGIADVKTTEDASPDGFSKSIAKYGYDLQAAYYSDGVKAVIGKAIPFYFIAIEKKAPYAVSVYRADDAMIEAGRNSTRGYKAALAILAWCRENDNYPSYQGFVQYKNLEQIETIGLPRWAANSAESFAEDVA